MDTPFVPVVVPNSMSRTCCSSLSISAVPSSTLTTMPPRRKKRDIAKEAVVEAPEVSGTEDESTVGENFYLISPSQRC